MAAPENALFESGRPLLMAAAVSADLLWPNSCDSLECQHGGRSRDLDGNADPAQGKARHRFGRKGSMVPGPSGRDAVMHFERHDIAASENSVPNRGQRPGLLAEARALGADLLIKGAYTQSRLIRMRSSMAAIAPKRSHAGVMCVHY